MATCNDIDQSLASLQASNDAKIAALEAKLDGCCAKTDDALAKALEALQAVAGVVNDIRDIVSSIAIITQALGVIQAVVGQLSPLIGAVGAILNLLLTIGSLTALGARVDGVENGLTQLGNEVGANYLDLRNRITNISLTPGADGAVGATGAQGIQGERGLTGFTGDKGDKGDKGDRGDIGLTGERGINGLDGRTPVFGVDYFNGANGQDGRTPVKNVDYFDGVNGSNGLDGKDGVDGVDKGMNCQEMIDCLNQYNTNSNPNTNNFTEINNKLDNLTNTTNISGDKVNTMAFQLPAIAVSIGAILGLVNTILGVVDAIRNFLFPKPDPLDETQVRDILDDYFPDFAGTVNGSDCSGTTITKQYSGKGLIGLERLIGATTDLTNELLSDLCQDTNTQGFVNTTVCGKPFTGTFRGANEGIQRLGDLIGFAISENCQNTDDVIDRYDWGTKWNIQIKPQFELSLNVALDNKLDQYFPTISDSFQVSLCDGNTTSYGYLGKGFGGVKLALQAMHTMQTTQLDSYFACIVTNFFPEFSGILKTSFCDGTDYSESYLERGIIGLNNVLKLQNKMNLIWQNRFAECFLSTNTEKKYSGEFVSYDCQGKNISGGYFNLPIDRVLDVMFDTLNRKLDDLCGDYNDSILVQDCTGDIIRGEYQGKGYRGLQQGLQIHTGVLIEVIKSICDKLDRENNAPTSGLVRLEACDQVFQGTYSSPKKSETDAIAQLGFKLVGDAINAICDKLEQPKLDPRVSGLVRIEACDQVFEGTYETPQSTQINAITQLGFNLVGKAIDAICKKLEDDKNARSSGTLALDFCGKTEQINYLSSKENEVYGFTQLALTLIGKAFDEVCSKLNAIDINTKPIPEAITSGTLDINACGLALNAGWSVLKSQEPKVIAQAQLALQQRILNVICEKLDLIDPNNPTNNPNISGNLNALVCGKPYSYSYGVPESALSAELVKGNLDILARVLNDFCETIKPEEPQYRTVFGDICNTPISYPLLLTSGEYQVAQSSVSAIGDLAQRMCQEFNDLDSCDPMIIEPSDKYIDRLITSQATIWFYPVGTTRSERKNSPKWRLNIANPRPNLTCADFAPLTWQRGYWLSKVRFEMGGIETYSYFADYDPVNQTGDAVDKMLHLASLSTIPLKSNLPRPTRTNFPGVLTPNQPTIEVVKVIFTWFDSNGQRTAVECLQCVP